MKSTGIVAAALLLAATQAAPAAASNAGFRLQQSHPIAAASHRVIGINFANGWALTIIVSRNVSPQAVMSGLFYRSSCGYSVGSSAPDSCVLADDPSLECTRYLTTCNLTETTMGYNLDRAIAYLSTTSSLLDLRRFEVWNGAPMGASQEYVSIRYPSEDAEYHVTASTSGPDDDLLTMITQTPPPATIQAIVIDNIHCWDNGEAGCDPQRRGGCFCSIRIGIGSGSLSSAMDRSLSFL